MIKNFNDYNNNTNNSKPTKLNEARVNESNIDSDEYLAFWSDGAFSVDSGFGEGQGSEYQIFHSKEELLETICEDNGYSPEEIEQVSNLSIGNVWKSNDYGTYHMILMTKSK